VPFSGHIFGAHFQRTFLSGYFEYFWSAFFDHGLEHIFELRFSGHFWITFAVHCSVTFQRTFLDLVSTHIFESRFGAFSDHFFRSPSLDTFSEHISGHNIWIDFGVYSM
jgi:hypothetical protein